MSAKKITDSERQESYLDGVFRSGHPRIQVELVDSEEGRYTLLAYVSERLSVITELVHELGLVGAFRQHLQSILRVELPYWFHRALCIAFRCTGTTPEPLSNRSSVWAWRLYKRHQESDFNALHYPGLQPLAELERTIEEILHVATDENVSLLRGGCLQLLTGAAPDGRRRTEAVTPDRGLPHGSPEDSPKIMKAWATAPWQDRALALIIGSGHALSTARIAQSVGVSRATLYRNEPVRKALKLRPRKAHIRAQRLPGEAMDALLVRGGPET